MGYFFNTKNSIFLAVTLIAASFAFLPPTPLHCEQSTVIARTIPPAPVKSRNPLYWDWNQIDTSNLSFPAGFLWGAASSAQQVEGSCTNNDWSAWETQQPIEKAGKACDQWNRYQQDIELKKKAGINTYRFSVEWSKIEPRPSVFDEDVLKHYQHLCQELVRNNIKPVITLHHYTNPDWFMQLGGFEKSRNIHYYVRFCEKIFTYLHPYVHLWLTFNSPTSYVARAYYKQLAPPGKVDMQIMQNVLRNILEAHVQAYQALKKIQPKSQIGITHNIYQIDPITVWDKVGAHVAYKLFNESVYKFFTTGIFEVSIPFKANIRHRNLQAPHSLDFIGLNYYSHAQMKNFNVSRFSHEIPTDNEMYSIYPEGLYRALKEITRTIARPLNIPIYVTENGIATHDENIRDLFYQRYLYALSYAINKGCPVKGYIVWSLMDNYEWGSYKKPYGIYTVDFATQERSAEPRPGAKFLIETFKRFAICQIEI